MGRSFLCRVSRTSSRLSGSARAASCNFGTFTRRLFGWRRSCSSGQLKSSGFRSSVVLASSGQLSSSARFRVFSFPLLCLSVRYSLRRLPILLRPLFVDLLGFRYCFDLSSSACRASDTAPTSFSACRVCCSSLEGCLAIVAFYNTCKRQGRLVWVDTRLRNSSVGESTLGATNWLSPWGSYVVSVVIQLRLSIRRTAAFMRNGSTSYENSTQCVPRTWS